MALREVFASFGVNVDASKLDDLNKKVDAGSSKLRGFIATLATGATVKAIFSFAEGLSEQGSAIKDNALKLGISTAAYQELGYAAQVSGSNVETMTNGLQLLQDNLATAATKGGDAAAAFTSLGIKVKDSHGNIRDTEAVMADAADAIAKMDSPAKQTAAAMNLFGRAGKQLLPVLKGGSKEINRLRAEAKELGGGFDEAAVAASDEFGDAMDRANLSIASMRGKIATALLPVMQKLVDWFTKGVAWFTKIAKAGKIIEVGLIALGTVLAAFAVKAVIAMAPVIAPFIFWGVIIGGLILLVEDLYVWFKGGKSVVGEWLTALLGAKDAQAVLDTVRDAVKGISEWVTRTARDFRDFLRWVDEAATKLAALVGLKNAALAKGNSEDDRNAMRRSAAMSGQTVRFPGETPEQAQANMGRARSEIQANRQISADRAGSMQSSTNAPISIVVNAANADAREVARLVDEKVNQSLTSNNRAAAQSLTSEAP